MQRIFSRWFFTNRTSGMYYWCIILLCYKSYNFKKKGYVISLHRSPSQTPVQFDKFLGLFEDLLQGIFKFKSSFVFIVGVFNCRNSGWFLGDPQTPQGTRVEAFKLFLQVTTANRNSNISWSKFDYLY